MRNREEKYWQDRFALMEANRYKDCQELYEKIAAVMDQNISVLNDKIEIFIYRYAKDNRVSIQEAKKLLNSKELEEFRWSVKKYIKYGEENSLSGEFERQLKNASKRVHVNRLEALQVQCQYIIESTFGQTIDSVDAFVKSTYEQEMYHTAYEIEKGVEVGCDFAKVNKKKLDLVVNKAWCDDGITFSKRLWNRSDRMSKAVEKELIRIVATGENADKAAKHITEFSKETGKSAKRNAKTLILTENAYFSSAARLESFKELGVEEYQISATLDERTSETCQDMDHKHFPLAEYSIGATAPPFHVRCRTVTIPYFEDLKGTRIDGYGNHVPRDMSYHEWKKEYLKG